MNVVNKKKSRAKIIDKKTYQNANQMVEVIVRAKPKHKTTKHPPLTFSRECPLKNKLLNLQIEEKEKQNVQNENFVSKAPISKSKDKENLIMQNPIKSGKNKKSQGKTNVEANRKSREEILGTSSTYLEYLTKLKANENNNVSSSESETSHLPNKKVERNARNDKDSSSYPAHYNEIPECGFRPINSPPIKQPRQYQEKQNLPHPNPIYHRYVNINDNNYQIPGTYLIQYPQNQPISNVISNNQGFIPQNTHNNLLHHRSKQSFTNLVTSNENYNIKPTENYLPQPIYNSKQTLQTNTVHFNNQVKPTQNQAIYTLHGNTVQDSQNYYPYCQNDQIQQTQSHFINSTQGNGVIHSESNYVENNQNNVPHDQSGQPHPAQSHLSQLIPAQNPNKETAQNNCNCCPEKISTNNLQYDNANECYTYIAPMQYRPSCYDPQFAQNNQVVDNDCCSDINKIPSQPVVSAQPKANKNNEETPQIQTKEKKQGDSKRTVVISSSTEDSPYGNSALQLIHYIREKLQSCGDSQGVSLAEGLEVHLSLHGSNSAGSDLQAGNLDFTKDQSQDETIFKPPMQDTPHMNNIRKLLNVINRQKKIINDALATNAELKQNNEHLVTMNENLKSRLDDSGIGTANTDAQNQLELIKKENLQLKNDSKCRERKIV